MGTWKLLLVGVIIHTIFFYSIFDIYFTSPIVHGMTPHSSPGKPPAKRLVLFSADGLRADKMFELTRGETRIPYLRRIIERTGAWGVSHTRVPTESRPGHVALIAGFYEDVSAVAKGWKENPVEFDSVFNQSRYTWSWGSPDILPMFAKGATGSHVFTDCFPAEYEDFGGSNRSGSSLDTWVFDKFKEFLESSNADDGLRQKLKEDKIIFFLHLLGIDINGHAMKPYSSTYLDNIRLVDKGIEEAVKQIEAFYNNDGQTAYILTSDHGMTDWGSHGAGHPSETLTPIVAWGAGVRRPIEGDNSDQFNDNYQYDWKLDHVKRTDINQADVAPLMAALIGVPYPINSVGVLPHDYLCTAVGEGDIAEMMYANARQILEQFQVKMELKKSTTLSATFRPFSELTPVVIAEKHRHFTNLLKKGRFQDVITESEDLINVALRGLTYYQTYDRFFLGASVFCGFLGWMAYVLTVIFEVHSGIIRPLTALEKQAQPFWKSELMIKMFFYLIGALIAGLLYIQSLPWTNFLYCLIPVVLWMLVALRFSILTQAFSYTVSMDNRWKFITAVVACLLGLEILVLGFFYREMFTIGLVFIGFLEWLPIRKGSSKRGVLEWTLSCLILAIFPMLPVITGKRDVSYVLAGGGLVIIAAVYMIYRLNRTSSQPLRWFNFLAVLQLIIVGISTYFSGVLVESGLSSWQQMTSWSILGLSFILPLCGPTLVYHRLFLIFLGCVAPVILLSVSYEVCFVVSLGFLLYQWVHMELNTSKPQDSSPWKGRYFKQETPADFVDRGRPMGYTSASSSFLVIGDIQRSFYFIFLILTAFFGTGNIASINSFDPASVLCFVSVFSPFTMGALLLLKVVIPFILVSCTLQAVHVITKLPIQGMCLLVFIMSDCMAVHFFFLVQDYGSWLDIGTSISHYVIVMTMIIFIMLLFGVASILTTWSFKLFSGGDKKRL